MAISPPSDLVLDVVRAADPGEVQVAREKLKSHGASAEASMLASAGAGFSSAVDRLETDASKAGLGNPQSAVRNAVPEVYRKFEATVLSNFIQNMLPSDMEEVYGKGSAGEFWKSMMAEQMAEAVARRGGIGIAEQMFAHSLQKARGAMPNVTADENDRSMAIGMITDFQRRTLASAASEDGDSSRNS